MSSGLNSLRENHQYIDSVSPVWYYLDDDGEIVINLTGLDEIKEITDKYNIELLPSIATFNPDAFSQVLESQELVDQHVEILVDEVDKYDFDGLDLDYESIYLNDKANFFYLVEQLSNEMKTRNKKLSIAVIAKWTDQNPYTSLSQTRRVQNWSRLQQYVDEFRIMTYDYTSPFSAQPGPVAPIDWIEAVLRYASRYVPAEKIYLGVNLYGYVWEYTETNKIYNSYFENEFAEDRQSYALTSGQLKDRFANHSGQIIDDMRSGENVFTYLKDGKKWIAFAPGIENHKSKADLAKKYGIGGVAYWKLGDEDSELLRQFD